MRQFDTKLFFLISLAFFANNAIAESGRLGGGFLGFGKDTVEISSGSPKEVLRERQARKSATLAKEKKGEITRNEPGKSPTLPMLESQINAKKSRMTAEERRALRRQIHDAGNDVYISPK